MRRDIISGLLLLAAQYSLACFTKRSETSDWSYDSPNHWADKAEYGECQNGRHQSPIALSESQLSRSPHGLSFNYSGSWTGVLSNNGHGLLFEIDVPEDDHTKLPKLSFDEETVYLQSWHTHAPAEHIVAGDRSTAELHFVHVDADGNAKAVVGFRLDPSYTQRDAHSKFFQQLGPFPNPGEEGHEIEIEDFQPNLALAEVSDFRRFWTYGGSLTTPPCSEGVRWFFAGDTLVLGDGQLQQLLAVSHFSARPIQHVWLHDVGK
ncbi:hypothetical protein AC578_5970 [Pseudocercospora eumusae]|uniref:Alpha-carbonic anhydrase domain-containing protein n=1 Tax=Pseudocercospora eumusae TaxID=321146 RepID=A0A139HIC0_9PEZI|nr:hypothetical protein AC578_5970 [Pseudocercospora eumusae]